MKQYRIRGDYLNYNDFKIMHSEIIAFFQIIENDLKWIYSLMHVGNIEKNYDALENKNLGYIIKNLRELDYSDNKPVM